MLGRLINWFLGWRARRVHEGQLREARLMREAARKRLRDAIRRGDDRDTGQSIMWLRQATSDVLRLELGR